MAKYNIKNIKADAQKFIEQVNEKNPYYLVIGVLIVVLLLDYFLIMQFQLGQMRTLGPKITEIKKDIQLFENNKDRVDKYKEDIIELDVQLAGLQERLRTTEEIPIVLENLSRLANDNKVFIEQILPETSLNEPILENKEGRFYLLPVLIDARSSYHHFGQFVNDLEIKGALMRIDRLSILTNIDNPRQHRIKLTILAVIFEPKGR